MRVFRSFLRSFDCCGDPPGSRRITALSHEEIMEMKLVRSTTYISTKPSSVPPASRPHPLETCPFPNTMYCLGPNGGDRDSENLIPNTLNLKDEYY